MEQIKLIAETQKGEEAIKKHIREKNKLPFAQKRLFYTFYRDTIISEKPFIYALEIKAKVLKNQSPESFLKTIRDTMKENEAEEGKDYKIEVT